MKPAYIPDTVIYGVTDKIPNIKTKKNMKKVYVVVCDSVTRGEQEITLKTFASKANAQNEIRVKFQAELADWKSWCEEDSLKVEDESINSKCIYENGYYCQNHIAWVIHEQDVL